MFHRTILAARRARSCLHTARQAAHDVAVHDRTLHQVGPRPAATVTSCGRSYWTRSGGGPRATSIFAVTLSDAGSRRERTPSRRSACLEVCVSASLGMPVLRVRDRVTARRVTHPG